MSVTVDANVLIYASNVSDPAHARARQLVQQLADGPDLFYLFWPTILGYLRIVTHPAILPAPLAPSVATANISSLLSLRHVRSPGELDGFWDLFHETGASNLRGNLVPDAHLATLMRQHGVKVIHTRDRDFRRFDGVTVEDPFA